MLNGAPMLDGLSPEDAKAYQVFHPYALKRQLRAYAETNFRFVHYTGAEAAFGILENKCIWMRNVSCMNDFMEVNYGVALLKSAYDGLHGVRLRALLESVHEGICEEIEDLFDGWSPRFTKQCLILCVSEHKSKHDEDLFGRLSMWRAYGAQTRVALVLNKKAFLSPTDAFNAYTSPVAYLTPKMFECGTREIRIGS